DSNVSTTLHKEESDSSFDSLRWTPAPKYAPSGYTALSKSKLSAFVVLTAMAGYALAPGAVSVPILLYTTVGTALCSASANAINQWLEAPYDAQMSRTRNRPLVRHGMSPLHAFLAGAGAGVTGVSILAHFVNPITAVLGASNILLYTCVYTPLKRTSIVNTWAGAVVGAIPPMMGWAACTGTISDPGAWVLAAILYAWQFPHFNSLSWNLRADYSKAGYRMMSVTDPALNARTSLRHSLFLLPLCWMVPYLGLTTWWFALDSTIVNATLSAWAWKFWRKSSEKTARPLFFASLVHLPVVLALLMIHKRHDREDE
ncbi:UbiA prenyltransferase family-domain-containing protein, partial [Gaertneriomyces semiglobifer]